MIAISNQPASRTSMLPHRERLADFCAAQTGLTCTARVNFHEQPTSILRFVGQHVYESGPSSIVDTLREHSARQPLNVQILDRNQTVLVDDLARFFVVKVATLIADVIMKPLQKQNRFASAVRSLLATGYAMDSRSHAAAEA